MKKIPTLFVRKFVNGKCVGITDQVTPGLEWVLAGEGVATVKYDGACCAMINDRYYKRYDAKGGKKPPAGAIPCCDPDPVTGHWPHWVMVSGAREDKWFLAALANTEHIPLDSTCEAVGPHFNGNPYNLEKDKLVPHGQDIIQLGSRSFDAIRDYLETHDIEGIVFWRDGQPQCKIKRKDFGFAWPVKETKTNEA